MPAIHDLIGPALKMYMNNDVVEAHVALLFDKSKLILSRYIEESITT